MKILQHTKQAILDYGRPHSAKQTARKLKLPTHVVREVLKEKHTRKPCPTYSGDPLSPTAIKYKLREIKKLQTEIYRILHTYFNAQKADF